MKTMALSTELLKAGWDRLGSTPARSRRLAIIAARFYTGVESAADLKNRVEVGELTETEHDTVIRLR